MRRGEDWARSTFKKVFEKEKKRRKTNLHFLTERVRENRSGALKNIRPGASSVCFASPSPPPLSLSSFPFRSLSFLSEIMRDGRRRGQSICNGI